MALTARYGLFQLLAFLCVRQILSASYNTANFGTCDASCQATQRDGLMALYDATEVKKALVAGTQQLTNMITQQKHMHFVNTGFCMDHQHKLGIHIVTL